MVDYIDIKILNLLKENSRVQWRGIGKEIHMTGQAVGNRIRKREKEGIIRAYTILLDEMKLGKSHLAFIIPSFSRFLILFPTACPVICISLPIPLHCTLEFSFNKFSILISI